MEHWSIEDYKNFTNNKTKKSKYRANKVSVDGHTFDSQKEADFYCELKFRLQSKEINGFCLQPIFMLAPGLKYKPDFIIFNKVFRKDFNEFFLSCKLFRSNQIITCLQVKDFFQLVKRNKSEFE